MSSQGSRYVARRLDGSSLCGVMYDPIKVTKVPLEDGQMSQAGGSSGKIKHDGNSCSGGGNAHVGNSKFGHSGQSCNPAGAGSGFGGMVHSFGGGHSIGAGSIGGKSQEDGMVHSFGGMTVGGFGQQPRSSDHCGGKGSGRRSGYTSARIRCYRCGYVGHIAARCKVEMV